MKFNVNTKVKIIDCIHGHGFRIGDEVSITEIQRDRYICTNGAVIWFLSEEEVIDQKSELLVQCKFNSFLQDLFYSIENQMFLGGNLISFDIKDTVNALSKKHKISLSSKSKQAFGIPFNTNNQN